MGKYQSSPIAQKIELNTPKIDNNIKVRPKKYKYFPIIEFLRGKNLIKNKYMKCVLNTISTLFQINIIISINNIWTKAKLDAAKIASDSNDWYTCNILMDNVLGVVGARIKAISITEEEKAITINITNLILWYIIGNSNSHQVEKTECCKDLPTLNIFLDGNCSKAAIEVNKKKGISLRVNPKIKDSPY